MSFPTIQSPPTMPKGSFDLAIVGGGIAGLALAIALQKHANIKLTIYESAQRFGEIGAGVSFGPNAIRAMELINPAIREGFEKVATKPLWESKKDVWFDFRNGQDMGPNKKSGSHLQTLSCPGNIATVHRAEFLDALVHLIPDDMANFGKRVVSIKNVQDGLHLIFKDGSEATHHAVIGCDGIKSEVRKYVLGKDNPASYPVYTGKSCHRGLVPMDMAVEALGEELAKNNNMYIGQGGHIVSFPVQKGKKMNVVAHYSRPTWDNKNWVIPATLEEIQSEYEGWGEPVQKMIGLMEKLDTWALFEAAPAEMFYRSQVCIIGDAAHASTPHQGSGAGMAIEDAYILGILLGEIEGQETLEIAFCAYDSVRRRRTQRLVETSRKAGQLFSMELDGVGSDLQKIHAAIHDRLTWIWSQDFEAEAQQARDKLAELTKDRRVSNSLKKDLN